jgi:hypothetical protein
MPVGVMNRRLNFRSVPYFESVATTGAGILETFIAIAQETVSNLFQKYNLDNKVQNINSLHETVESSIRSTMSMTLSPVVEPVKEKTTVLRQGSALSEGVSEDSRTDPDDLLIDALNSNMETALLYSDLKKTKENLEKQNAELTRLNVQLTEQLNLEMKTKIKNKG